MHREEALGILGLAPSEAKDFAAVRAAYHRRMRAVHPDLNPAPEAADAAAMVSAAYDLLDRSYRSQKQARVSREAATAREAGSPRSRSPRRATNSGGTKVRVLNDTTVTSLGTPSEIFAMAKRAAALIGEVSSIDAGTGMILVTAEFLHMPPCQVTLIVVKRGVDRVHVRCSVDALSPGEAPPIAAVTRLIAQKLGEVASSTDTHIPNGSTSAQRAAAG